jgi:hypothetical protein
MPQARDVVLNYDPANAAVTFGPTPRQVSVGPNDTIRFRIGESTRAAQPHSKLRITLHHGRHFSKRVLQHSPEQTGAEELTVTVVASAAELTQSAALTANIITGYKCELLDANGSPIPHLVSDGSDGGEIVPDSGSDS